MPQMKPDVSSSAASPGNQYRLSTGEVLDEYETLIRQALRAARVSYDVFIDPRADGGYRAAVASLLDELVASKAAVVEEVTLARCAGCRLTLHHAHVTGGCPLCGAQSGGGTCEGCGAFTTATNLRDARCARCGRRSRCSGWRTTAKP